MSSENPKVEVIRDKWITLVSREDFLELLDCVKLVVSAVSPYPMFGAREEMIHVEQRLYQLKEKYNKNK